MLAPGHTHNISFPFIKPGEKWKLSFSQCMVIKLGMQYAWNGGGGGAYFQPVSGLEMFPRIGNEILIVESDIKDIDSKLQYLFLVFFI